MRRPLTTLMLLLAGCGGDDAGGGGGGGSDAAVAADAAPQGDAAPADPQALLASACDRRAEALCAKAFECLDANRAAIAGVLGLPGNDEASCAAGVASACREDIQDRLDRGAIALPADPAAITTAADGCVRQIGSTPCVAGDPEAWVANWNQRMHSVCVGVAPGAAQPGEACERREDCAVDGQICADGRCRNAAVADLQMECTATGADPGRQNPDRECPGNSCVQVNRNRQDIDGLCTVDCRTGRGCPTGSFCINASLGNGPPSFYCTAPCTEDRDCEGDLRCIRVSAESREKHCWVSLDN